jgi:hypothetical protein
MVPEELLFWVAPFDKWVDLEAGVLCRRHADSMVVPRGWVLDDRRELTPRLFRPTADQTGGLERPRRRSSRPARPASAVQLELVDDAVPDPPNQLHHGGEWSPEFDVDDDLDGLLEVRSPLLARAFRGTGRPRP